MKKIFLIIAAAMLSMSAFAQKGGHGGGFRVIAPRPVIVMGAYSPFYFGMSPYFWGGYPYGFGPYGYYRYDRPTRLDLKIESIRNDYRLKIQSARNDNSITKSERKQNIRDLRHERNQDIITAKEQYYKMK